MKMMNFHVCNLDSFKNLYLLMSFVFFNVQHRFILSSIDASNQMKKHRENFFLQWSNLSSYVWFILFENIW